MSSAPSSRPEYAAPNTPAYIHDADAFADAEDDDTAPTAPPPLSGAGAEPVEEAFAVNAENEGDEAEDDWNQDEEDEEWAQLGAVEDEDWGGHEKGASRSRWSTST